MNRKQKLWWGAVVLWTFVIFSFSLQPADESSAISLGFLQGILDLFAPGLWEKLHGVYSENFDLIHTLIRKGAHFTEYMVLGFFTSNAMKDRKMPWKLGYCVAVAAVDETIQRFVEGRYGCLRDVCIDSAGALTGLLIILLFRSIRNKKQKNNTAVS